MPENFENLTGGTLRVRLSSHLMHRLQAGAQLSGAPSVSAYARRLLDDRQSVVEELMSLRRIMLERGAEQPGPGHDPAGAATDPRIGAAAIETLLLLRSLVKPETLRAAHADLQRMKIEPLRIV